MDDKVPATLERHQNELAMAPDGRDAAAFDARRHLFRIDAPQHAPAAELGRHDPAAYQRGDGAHHRFYFGEFWHSKFAISRAPGRKALHTFAGAGGSAISPAVCRLARDDAGRERGQRPTP